MRLRTTSMPQALTPAQHRYFAISEPAEGILEILDRTGNLHDRADLLNALADIEADLATAHADAWGPDPNPDERNRDHAESLASAAALLRLLADTEQAEFAAPVIIPEMSRDEAALWAELGRTADRRNRAALIDRIHGHAAARVGGQAAETLRRIAESEQRVADRTTGHRPPLFEPGHLLLALIFTAVAVLLLVVKPG